VYVGIDSLCIVQDDADDWDKHCATMATIYPNASLVLAATALKDSQGGLFRKRSTKLEFASAGRTIFARRETGHGTFACSSGRFYAQHEDLDARAQMSLLSRAWVFQERLISGAIVYFMNEELVWECLECHQCECGLSSIPNYHPPPLPLRRFLRGEEQSSIGHGELHGWEELIQNYTRKELTFRKDLLPALSALAMRYGQSRDKNSAGKPQDTYLAGLWRAQLRTQMLWYYPRRLGRREQISSDVASPS
jgi:hypothetical protein